MPVIQFFVSEEIYKKIFEFIKEKIVPNEAEAVVIALLLLIRSIEYCKEQGIDPKECFDKVIDFIVSK